METTLSQEHLAPLTGLRYLLALHVVLFHSYATFDTWPDAVARIVGAGYVAVEVFFVLSGFILVYTYVRRHDSTPTPDTPAPRLSLWTFYAARLARIYPLYLLAFLSFLPEALVWAPNPFLYDNWKGVAHLFAVQTWMPNWVISWNIPGWSIGNELFFYALFPWLAIPLLRRRIERRGLWLVIVVCWVLGSLAPAWWIASDPESWGFVSSTGESPFAAYSPALNVLKFNPLLHLPAFLAGMAFGALFLDDRRADRHPRGDALSLGSAAAVLVVLAMSHQIPFPLLHQGTLIPLYGLLIYGLAHGSGPLARALGTRPMVLLGHASFAVYLLQSSLILIWGRWVGEPYPGRMSFHWLALYIAVLTLISIAVYRGFERPARHFLRTRLRGSR